MARPIRADCPTPPRESARPPISRRGSSRSGLEARAGIKMVHVPYRGAQPALTDVMAGNVDLFFDTPTTSVPLYRNKMLNILAVADLERTRALPEIPTFSEA